MLAILNVLPMGKSGSLAKSVASYLDLIDKSGLDYRVTSMGTIIEGDWDAVMALVKRVRDRALKDTDRVAVTLSIDDRKDRRRRIEEKVRSAESALGRSVRK